MEYTVVGAYLDSGEPFVDHVKADEPHKALGLVENQRSQESTWECVAVFEGHHMSLTSHFDMERAERESM